MPANSFYEQMKSLRGQDRFPTAELERYLVEKCFPRTAETMALKLSNVTAGFYALTLQQVGLQCGWDKVDSVSQALLRQMGHLKTREAREMGIELPPDTRALGMILVTAVYTSSPEYRLEFSRYSPEETTLRIFGADRYYRVARKIGIQTHLTWPVLRPFFVGIAEELGIPCTVEMAIERLDEDGTCDFRTRFTLGKSPADSHPGK